LFDANHVNLFKQKLLLSALFLHRGMSRRFLRWSAQEKIQALDGLINVCQPHEVRHMLGVIEPQFQRDFISLLPKEVRLPVSIVQLRRMRY